MVPGSLPASTGRDALIATRKKQRPLIRYAGSAAETSIGSKPIGSELDLTFYPGLFPCQVSSCPAWGSGVAREAQPIATIIRNRKSECPR